jgi:hypothetical protein
MKRAILFLILIISITQTGWSQISKFQLGIDAGPSVSMYTGGSKFFELESINSYSFSGTAQFNFSSKLALVTGFGLEQKGYVQSPREDYIDYLGFEGFYRTDISFLNLPLMLRYSIGKGKLKAFGNLGGYLGFILKSRTYEVGSDPSLAFISENIKKLKNIDFGLSAGLGMSYAVLDRLNVTFEVRDNFGLYYLNTTLPENHRKSFLNSVNFLFGINYGLGSK